MKQYLKLDPWRIIEDSFCPEVNRISESVFSIGNGHMGQRANFEEQYSGDSLKGSYIAGVYYPDKTRVGWWKNGYPEYFAKVINSANWIGINVSIDNEKLDLAECTIIDFQRILDMKDGCLIRTFTVMLKDHRILKAASTRFLSMCREELGCISYSITPINFKGNILIEAYIDGDVANEDSNYDEKFWQEVKRESSKERAYLTMKTKKLDFYVCTSMSSKVTKNGIDIPTSKETDREKYVSSIYSIPFDKMDEITVYKYAANTTSRDHLIKDLEICADRIVKDASNCGFPSLFSEQAKFWHKKWDESDVIIEGDTAAQQAIRFNIFQLNQTYTGTDDRLNIGPKGFTGEKYGGSTYWDTEAYCIPFYLSTADSSIARKLLIYRYNQLDKARENARKLGFKKGALYPMVTMNGEECHNEWEITFEEIHRNGAIAYAIYNYVNYTGDKDYLLEYGAEVLIEISRFWKERANYSVPKGKYMILGVTGPNEYENNVNNNWYTNRIAVWTLEYTLETLSYIKEHSAVRFDELAESMKITETELKSWQHIIANMYYPVDEELGIFLQQDGYMDKEQLMAKDIDPSEIPINQHWSWDRILRSCFIKQADVLQGLYFLGHRYSFDVKKRNFDFYEPRTVHESSLSPCVHSILASELGYKAKAYELYLRTARLDLDNYNNDTKDGCHITSMAGSWMSVVHGFGGLRIIEGILHLDPYVPLKWLSLSFKIIFRGAVLNIKVFSDRLEIAHDSDKPMRIYVHGTEYLIPVNDTAIIHKI